MSDLEILFARSGMTQAETARRLGICRQTVGKWCTGKHKPSNYYIARIADICCVGVEDVERCFQ